MLDRRIGRRIAELRLRLAADPRDPDVHVALARALMRAGRPGGALRHLAEASRRGELAAADARALAALHAGRARARLALGEGDGWRDLEAADRLDPAGAGARRRLLLESYAAGALAALRRGDGPGRRAADRLLERVERIDPRDARLAARAPAEADLADVGAAGAWLADGGARRAALSTYAVYVARGGRAADHLRRYLRLHRWWYGSRERPSPALLAELLAERFDLCGAARAPGDLGCAGSLVRAAEHDPPAAEEIRQLAAARGWRSADPAAAGAWAVVALRAWQDGRVSSWEAELAERVDLAAVVATEVGRASVPRHAQATILRAAGMDEDARAALDRALEGAAALSPEARALLVAEAAAQGRESAIDALLRAGPASATAWRAALAAARAAEPGGAREAALCDAAPLEVARDHLRASGELGALAARFPTPDAIYALARWRAALRWSRDPRLARGREALEARWRRLSAGAALPARLPAALPLGVVDPNRIPGPGRVRVDGAPALTDVRAGTDQRTDGRAGSRTGRHDRGATALADVRAGSAQRTEGRAGSRKDVRDRGATALADVRAATAQRTDGAAGSRTGRHDRGATALADVRAATAQRTDGAAGSRTGMRDRGATDGLERVARAYLRDPALADRLAGELADGAFAIGQRGPLLVELFARLNDPARALEWAERTSESSPDHAPYLLAAGLAAIAAGDAPRADVFFVRGASASGDAGGASLLEARAFLAASRPLAALAAARRAIDLTAPGEPEHAEAVLAAARALELLGRAGEARALVALLPAGADRAAGPAFASLPATDAPPADIALPPPDAPAWPTEVASLLAAALIAPPERAAPALAALAAAFERAGLVDLARAARRERLTLLGPATP